MTNIALKLTLLGLILYMTSPWLLLWSVSVLCVVALMKGSQ